MTPTSLGIRNQLEKYNEDSKNEKKGSGPGSYLDCTVTNNREICYMNHAKDIAGPNWD
jgi:hypothetical protein